MFCHFLWTRARLAAFWTDGLTKGRQLVQLAAHKRAHLGVSLATPPLLLWPMWRDGAGAVHRGPSPLSDSTMRLK